MADMIARRRNHLKSKRRSDALVFLSNIPLDGPGQDIIQLKNARSSKIKHRMRSEEGLLGLGPVSTTTNNQNRQDFTSNRPVVSEEVLVHHDKVCDGLNVGLGHVHHQVEHTGLRCGMQRRSRDELDESLGLHRNSVVLRKDRSRSIQICQGGLGLNIMSPDVDERIGLPVPPLSSCGSSGNIRMVLVSSHRSPFAIFSFLSYKRLKAAAGRYEVESNIHLRSRKHSGNQQIGTSDELTATFNSIEVADSKTVSYCHFLVPTREHLHMQHIQLKYLGQDIPTLPNSPAAKKITSHPLKTAGLPPSPTKVVDAEYIFHENIFTGVHLYDPNALDDPELSAGKHKKVLTFPSYMVSIIEHTKPTELKKDLNEQFVERFPRINLTLSKLRSIKKDMWKICMDCDVEPATLAQAYAYYEKLVLNGKIHKQNRKLCAGASLLLSVKLNDVKRSDLDDVIKEIEEQFRVSRKELFSYEFPVLVALEFSLHLSEFEVLPHYKRIIQFT